MKKTSLTFKLIDEKYAVCRLSANDKLPDWCPLEDFVSITKTEDELSIVCKEKYVSENVTSERDWRILKILGPLDFSLVGILSKITSTLALHSISVFAISTYDTDYILVKDSTISKTIEVLEKEGYKIIS